jgi:hypothetical protein
MLNLIKTNPFGAINSILLIAVLFVALDARELAGDAEYYGSETENNTRDPLYNQSIGEIVVANNNRAHKNGDRIEDMISICSR